MRVLAALCLLSSFVLAASAPAISHDEYKRRRAKLREALPDSLIVIFGATEQENGELRSGFFQSPDFYYLTGWKEPNAVLVLTPSGDTLLIPKRDKKQENGPVLNSRPGTRTYLLKRDLNRFSRCHRSRRICRSGRNPYRRYTRCRTPRRQTG